MTLGDNLNKKIPGASVGIFQVIPYLKKIKQQVWYNAGLLLRENNW